MHNFANKMIPTKMISNKNESASGQIGTTQNHHGVAPIPQGSWPVLGDSINQTLLKNLTQIQATQGVS